MDTPGISFVKLFGSFDGPAVSLCVLIDGEYHEGVQV